MFLPLSGYEATVSRFQKRMATVYINDICNLWQKTGAEKSTPENQNVFNFLEFA